MRKLGILFQALCLLTLFVVPAEAQVSDTKRTTNSTLLGKLQNASIFDRKTRWEIGGNWGCMASRTADSLFGMSLNDNSIGGVGTINWGVVGEMDRFVEKLRLIPINGSILFQQGFGIGTRIDPELAHSGGVVATETGTNTGATHTFTSGTAGAASSKYRQFRKAYPADIDTLSGNTNARVMTCDYNGNHSYKHVSSSSSTVVDDPGQTGEMLWVGVTLRRFGSVDVGDGSDPVLKITVRRQRQLLPLDSIHPGHIFDMYCPDTVAYKFEEKNLSVPPKALGFSFLPDTAAGGDNVAVIGVDSLPRLSRAMDSVAFNGPTAFDTLTTPLRKAKRIPSWSGTAKEDVWKHYKDVRSSDDAYEIIITRGMLNALNAAPVGTNSAWTDIDGLLVLPRPAPTGTNPETRSPFVLPFDLLGSTPLTLAHKTIINFPLAGGSTDERFSPVATFRLDVSMEYIGNVDVDVDNIFIRTPNLRAMMREMYRDTLEDEALATINACMDRADTLNLSTVRILGLRTMEERGENSWWAQRYMSVLLNGMTITEMNYRPFDKWKHVAYPMGSGDPIPPVWRTGSDQRVITWNEQALGRVKPTTPAPYLRYGKLYSATLGVGYGLCKDQYHIADLACDCNPALPDNERRQLLNSYEIGFNLSYDHLNTVKAWDSVQYSHPTSCDGSTRVVLPESFPHLHGIEYYLYRNFIEEGNRRALFGDTDWLEQVWIGGSKSHPNFPAPGDMLSRFVVLDRFESQGRPATSEEIRLRLSIPTMLASSGLVYYFGPSPMIVYDALHNTIPAPSGGFGDVINHLEYFEGKTESDSTIEAHYRGDEYGADYPVPYDVGEDHAYVRGGDTLEAEVKLPNMVQYRHLADTTLLPLWIDTDVLVQANFDTTCAASGYEDIVGGYDLVRRVDLSDSTFRTGVPLGERLYFGARSVRNELLDFSQQVGRVCEIVGSDTLRWRDVFRELDLGSWYAKGFKKFELRDEVEYPSIDPLKSIISVSEVRTRHPYRVTNARADYEGSDSSNFSDSSFYDLTYLGRRSSADVYGTYRTDEFWLGVQNRRTNPIYMLPDSLQEDPKTPFAFSSGIEFAAISSKANSGIRPYDQLGSRAIIIPFKYVKAGQGPKLLHITEMGVDTTAVDTTTPWEDTHIHAGRHLIDTIVDAFSNWEVLLRPGEGKLFRIQIIDASADAAVGNLAFNTQTKLILAREQAEDTINVGAFVLTDKLRYHLVYMREKIDTLQVPPNVGHRVYYRRSLAYTQQQLPNVADIRWDAEIEIGNDTRVRAVNPPPQPVPPGTLNQTGDAGLFGPAPPVPPAPPAPYVYNVDKDWTNADNTQQENDGTSLQAFFPSITVGRKVQTRFTANAPPAASAEQFVTIAYSLLVDRQNRPREIHIAEVQFRDTPTGVTPTLGIQHSLAITRHEGALPPPALVVTYTVDTLALWGTPTNGTTAVLPPLVPGGSLPNTVHHYDRVFTAWSVRPGIGITNGSKPCDGVTLFYGPADYEVLNITQTGKQAQYPSLSPYSVTTTSFPSPAATLVWQETDSVPAGDTRERYGNIMYTRVYEQAAPVAHVHAVPQSTLLHYVVWTPPSSDTLVPFDNGTIYRISQTLPGTSSLYPTVVRGGMIDGPWLDGRTLGSRLRLYNELSCTTSAPAREFDFEYEYLAWQETLPGGANSQVRRRYFLMDKETATEGIGDTMRIWAMNTVAHSYQSCATPVVSLAAMRLDSQLFRLGGANPLLYADPDYCRMQITGNISDTSVFCTFGLFQNIVNGPEQVGAVHWSTFHTGWPSGGPKVVQHPHRFAPFSGSTSNFSRYSNFDANGTEISRDPGQWPHIAHRAFGVPVRREELRRVQEADDTARIVFTSESYMKPTADVVVVDHHYAGFVHNGEELVVRCEDADGRELPFRLDRDDRFVGAGELMRHLSYPTVTLVTDAIEVGDDVELTLDNIGSLRDGVEIRFEDVDVQTGRGGNARVALTLTAPSKSDDPTEKNLPQRNTYRLINGGSKLYRLRLTVPDGSIMNEVTILDAEAGAESKGKGTRYVNMQVVDLASGFVRSRTDAAKPLVYPNPASTEIRVIPPTRSTGSSFLNVELVDGLGRIVASWRGEYTSVVVLPIEYVPSGIYSVRTTWASGEQASVTVAIQR